MTEDELERRAADLWRAENPDQSVFDCDAETKARYRRLALEQGAGMTKDEFAWWRRGRTELSRLYKEYSCALIELWRRAGEGSASVHALKAREEDLREKERAFVAEMIEVAEERMRGRAEVQRLRSVLWRIVEEGRRETWLEPTAVLGEIVRIAREGLDERG